MCKKIINTKKSISSVLQFGNVSMISEAYRRILALERICLFTQFELLTTRKIKNTVVHVRILELISSSSRNYLYFIKFSNIIHSLNCMGEHDPENDS